MVVQIGDVDVARAVHRHAKGVAELRLDCWAAVPTEAELAGPRERGDRSRGVHLADPVVARIGDVEVARSVYRHARGEVQLGLDRRTAVSAEPFFSSARDGVDSPVGRTLRSGGRGEKRGA